MVQAGISDGGVSLNGTFGTGDLSSNDLRLGLGLHIGADTQNLTSGFERLRPRHEHGQPPRSDDSLCFAMRSAQSTHQPSSSARSCRL